MENESTADETGKKFTELVNLVAYLRSDEGCEWDRQQTLETVRSHVMEEAGEVVESINSGNVNSIAEELGDLLLQVVFLSQIATEKEKFNINQVIDGICAKLRRRHPHVFGDVDVEGPEEILANWEEIKEQEKTNQN